MRWLYALLAWLVSTVVLAPVCFFVTILLAGPHSSMLPGAVQPVVFLLGWVTLLIAPLAIARSAWRRASA
jgi:hypothetical protein